MRALHVSVVPALLLAACASLPPRELIDARSAFDRASHGPAAQLAPADVQSAEEELNCAEVSFENKGDSPATRDLAYSAERRAELAEVRAEILFAQRQEADARAELERSRGASMDERAP